MIQLTDHEFEFLVSYVKMHFGLDLSKKRILIECRLNSQLQKYGATSFSEYIRMMRRDRTHHIGDEMIDRLTTHYTYFLRENQHFQYISKMILPELTKSDFTGLYTIWCAGCASGQECYSLAMFLEDYVRRGGKIPPYQIVGTDISSKVLKQAHDGIYPISELQTLPMHWRDQFCDVLPDGTHFRINEKLRRKIQFRKGNLAETASYGRNYDLILCRNVMIYFVPDVRKEIVKALEDSLKHGGYLIVGQAEVLVKDGTSLKNMGSAVYKKE